MLSSVSRRCFSSAGSHSVAFVGLGNMGASMAENLMGSGVSVKAFDLNKDAVAALAAKGAGSAESLADLKACDTIITMLPSSPHVQATVETMLEAGWKGKMWIDSSTIDPLVSKSIAEKLSSEGVTKLDAPVSGGVKGAAAGTLTFMVGGEKEGLDEAKVGCDWARGVRR